MPPFDKPNIIDLMIDNSEAWAKFINSPQESDDSNLFGKYAMFGVREKYD